MYKYIIAITIVLLSAFAVSLSVTVTATPVEAIDAPDFPNCANPGGNVKVKYDSGTHGIVGESGTYTGSDTVYTLDENRLVQCFCAPDGKGIQTNWWKVSSLNQQEIASLVQSGWIHIPTGVNWGLTDSSYLAKNINISCSNNGTGGGNSSSNILSSSATSGGQVLGLAATGNSATLYAIISLGVAFLSAGLWLKRKTS